MFRDIFLAVQLLSSSETPIIDLSSTNHSKQALDISRGRLWQKPDTQKKRENDWTLI